MTTSSTGTPPAPASVTPVKKSGIRTILRYTGIPPSWIDKRPKLPSRNWLIFLSVTSSALGLYLYDRQQCKKIRQEYVDKVKHLAEIPVDPFDKPRRVTVYGAKWPGDEDYDQGLRYFRKYVKPILVAAAIDYTFVPGKRHGDIARRVAEDVRLRRREDSGLDRESDVTKALPTYKPLPERRQRELDGGIVLVGRPTFKEFMAGLKRGWTNGLEKIDHEEDLARALEDDTHFDELLEEPVGLSNLGDLPLSFETPSASIIPSAHYSPDSTLTTRVSTKPQRVSEALVPSEYTLPPSVIPPQPPLLLVPFLDYIGFKQVPLMIWDFFNRRHQVRSGAKAGYKLVMAVSQPLHVPDPVEDLQESSSNDDTSRHIPLSRFDLDFDKRVELYYNKSTYSIPGDIEKAQQKYYEALPKKLATTRELARGIREPTKDELNNPPPTEVELRAERLKKEQRWRDDVEGWDIVRPSSDVAWDQNFIGALHIFVDPPENVGGADESLS